MVTELLHESADPLQILVVDDFDTMRRLITANLQQMGYTQILQAVNGRDALHKLKLNPAVGLIITDWNMPEMNGLALLKAVRASAEWAHCPVLMVTAEMAKRQVEEALAAGVSDFLIKPFPMGALQVKVRRAVHKGSALRSVASGAAVATEVLAQAPRLAPPGVERPALLPSGPAAAPRRRVLVVDDVSDNIDVIVGLLQDEYKVLAAKSGDAALRMIAQAGALPDLILLDVFMPEMDGFEVCRRLKANPASADIPVIFLTAADDVTHVVAGLALGAVDYVVKPAHPVILKSRVQAHLGRAQAFQAVKRQAELLAENLRLREEVEYITRHDLKNPIGGIMNFAELLLNDDELSLAQRDMLSTIGESARRMLNLVNRSLDLAKIEQGRYELQVSPVDLIAITRAVFKDLSAEFQAKRLQRVHTLRLSRTIDVDDEERSFKVEGDELLCYSVLGNLLRNAVEASPEGGLIEVIYSLAPGGWGEVQIINAGLVPEPIRARFFDKYVTHGKPGGTGLGTYSARRMVEVQHGQLALVLTPQDPRTTLCLRLPLVKPRTQVAGPVEDRPS